MATLESKLERYIYAGLQWEEIEGIVLDLDL